MSNEKKRFEAFDIEATVNKTIEWCDKHKKELIIGGIVVATVTGGIIIYKRKNRHAAKMIESATDVAFDVEQIDTHLPPLADAAGLFRNADEIIEAATPLTEAIGSDKTFIQTIANAGRDIAKLTDVEKIVPRTRADISETLINTLDKVLDNISVEDIEAISVLYDVADKVVD